MTNESQQLEEIYVEFLLKSFQLILKKDKASLDLLWESNLDLLNEDLLGYFSLAIQTISSKDIGKIKILNLIHDFAYKIQQFTLGNRTSNIEIAIVLYEAWFSPIEIKMTYPKLWANTQMHLGDAYRSKIKGNKRDNLELFINCWKSALEIYTREANPTVWAIIQTNLGVAYSNEIKGDKRDNLELSIHCLKSALEVHTRKANPTVWAIIQTNLGRAYRDRIKGDRKDNLELSIHCCKSALEIYTRKANPTEWVTTQFNLGRAYRDRIKGDRKDNLELSIHCYKSVLEVYTRKANPTEWAIIQTDLGNTYSRRFKGDRRDNLELSIYYYKLALEVHTRKANPTKWAIIQMDLGKTYSRRIKGDKRDNLELSIYYYKLAVKVHTRETYPNDWAIIQNNLGIIYHNRIKGDRKDNLELSIHYLKSALEVRTREAYPIAWAGTQMNLGNIYSNRIKGDRRDNLELSIYCYKLALEVHTREAYPAVWADTQMNLGVAYSNKIKGDKRDNLELSIHYLKSALEVRTREAYPVTWADTQINLGNAYFERIKGDKRDNLELSIYCYKLALEVRTREAYPVTWADTQNNLGNAYFERIKGDRRDNLELSIRCFKPALEVRTRKADPAAWADTQHNLGNTYRYRIKGDRRDNLELSIHAYKSALEVRTRKAYPAAWADTQNNLGNTYRYRIKGDRKDNLELSIHAYKSALEVHTREAYPNDWADTQINLGIAYQNRIKGDRRDNLELSIHCFKLALEVYTRGADPIKHNLTAHNLGNLFFQEARWLEAIEVYSSGIEAIEIIRNYAEQDDRRQEIQTDALNIYNNLIQACLNTAQIDKAVEYSERFRSRMLIDLVSGKELASAEVNDETKQLIEEFERLQKKIDLERQYLKSNDNNLNSDRSQYTISRAQLEESSTKIRQLEQEKKNVHQQIRALDPVMAGEIQVTPLAFQEIQQQIDNPQTAIVSFYSIGEDTHIFILYQDKAPQHYLCQQEGDALHSWISQEWLQPYQIAFSQKDETLKQQWRESMPDLLQKLAKRLEINNLVAEYLTDIEELIIIPHLYLHNIPFAAIPLSDSEFLGDKFRIRYAPSCQILQYCQEREPITEIKYGTIEDAQNNLPGARYEGAKIAQIRNIEDEYRLIGKDNCSVKNYRQLVKEVQVLHSSHHAVSRLDNPLESSLNLGDGDITVGELLLWRLKKLVEIFLSCCETNLGKVNLGDDVLTLASGFLCAGARAVVSSLWKADDLAATLLSIFYHQLRQENKSRTEALQQAQQKLRDLSGKELQDIYEQQFQPLHSQIKQQRKELRKLQRSYAQTNPEYDKIQQERDLLASNLDILERYSNRSQEDYPFDNPFYWAVFICAGLN